MRILVVEDEKPLANIVAKALKNEKYVVDVVYDGESALNIVKKNKFDLLILDIMLPKKSGLMVCSELRRDDFRIPILMLTALGGTDDLVNGFNCGADDYLAKPFEMKELLVRIRALLKRYKAKKKPKIKVRNIIFDTSKRIFFIDGNELKLSFREFGILELLFLNLGKIVSRNQILEQVWGEKENSVFTNTIDVHIRYLRKKIGNDFIETVKGFGYRVL